MFDYQTHFDAYCKEHDLTLRLSFDMPAGYETANGTFESESDTVCINAAMLEGRPDHEKAFYLFHELRHALQYLRPGQFDELVEKSRFYAIQYDGTCYKLCGGEWKECRLDGPEAYFTEAYMGQPYEVDANGAAYEKAKELFGDSPELRELYAFWLPKKPVPAETYRELYALIDKKIGSQTFHQKREKLCYSAKNQHQTE